MRTGRPPYQPTEETRQKVTIWAGGGMSHEAIAIALGVDKKTLEKHFAIELSEGAYKRRGEILEAMYRAGDKGNVTAQRAYLEREPEFALPASAEAAAEPKSKPKGKKEQANEDARVAQKGTEWAELLPAGQAH